MILFISNHDYARFSHNMANAYRTVRSDIKDLTLHAHKFGYESQSTLVKPGDMERAIEKAEQIHIMHSDPFLFKMVMRWNKGAKLIHWATGSRYRQNPVKYNNMFNPYVEMTVIALTEFANLGAKNPHYIVGAIDTERIRPTRPYEGRIPQIYHLPSDPETKGTEAIFEIVRSLKGDFNFEYKLTPSPYKLQLELMAKCDIYLELFATTQGDKPYGSWGITALEAAAMGKVVFTQMNNVGVYAKTYGTIPKMFMLNEVGQWVEALQGFINRPKMIKDWQVMSRDWVEKHHSFRATGKKMKEMFAGL